MRMRVLRRKLTAAVMCGASAGAVLLAAPAASAADVGPAATAAFGIRFTDKNANGQCRVGEAPAGDVSQWVSENQWTRTLAIDTDDRLGGCDLYFGLNNVDGSLTGLTLSYTFQYSDFAGDNQCPSASPDPQQVPFFPLQGNFPVFFMSPIVLNTHDDAGGCTLKLEISGRADVALDVLYEFVGDGGQCPGAHPRGTNDHRTVSAGSPVTIGLDSDDRAGACLLSFRLRHF